jgi:predicted nucleic acid-binding protein
VVVALDTSVAIEVLADRAKSRTSQAIAEFLPPVPVVGELRHGALNSTCVEQNLAEVERSGAARRRSRSMMPIRHDDSAGTTLSASARKR